MHPIDTARARQGRVAAVVAIAAVIAGVAGIAAVVPARAVPPGRGEPTLGPLISGTSSYVDGTFVWTDYAYDDRGPDTDGTPGGDAEYPPEVVPNNVADLIQLQISAPKRDRLRVAAVLETLTEATRPLLGVALDSDADHRTGARSLPGTWVAGAPLGVDHLLVLGRDGGRVLRWTGTWQQAGTFGVAVDPERNTITGDAPFALPAQGPLRTAAAIGYDDGRGRSWTSENGTPVHDLAFVTDPRPETPYAKSVTDAIAGFGSGEKQWQEDNQSAILAGGGDPGMAVAPIDVAALRERRTLLATPKPHFNTFLYRSALRLREGVQGSGNAAVYLGPYQPYLVWVPPTLRPGLPLVLYLHGSSQTHLSAVNIAHYPPAEPDPVLRRPDAIFRLDAVVAWPLGRGPQTWYRGAAEVDPLEVADDVIARLSLDRDRVMLAGLSMGGFGTFHLAQLYPDRWSVAYADVGGDDTSLPENLTALPVRLQNGTLDPLVPLVDLSEGRDPTPAASTRSLLDGAGTVDYRSWVLTRGTHAPAVALAECVYRESFRRPRVRNPARVRYTVDPAMFVDADGVRLRYEGAYWVSGMRTTGGRGSIDVTTSALGHLPVPGPTTSSVHENVSAGRDFCGANPAVRTHETWTEQARTVVSQAAPVERRLTGKLTGLAAATIAADRVGLGGREPSTLVLETTDDAVLTLTGLHPGARVSRAGEATRANGKGIAVVRLQKGRNVVTVA